MATGDERIERPAGAIDNANQVFTTAVAYQAGSLRVWRNGVLARQADDDGWTETGSTTFSTSEAYLVGDTIHCRYIEA